MNKKKRKHIDYQEWLMDELHDPKQALSYLNEALADNSCRIFHSIKRCVGSSRW